MPDSLRADCVRESDLATVALSEVIGLSARI